MENVNNDLSERLNSIASEQAASQNIQTLEDDDTSNVTRPIPKTTSTVRTTNDSKVVEMKQPETPVKQPSVEKTEEEKAREVASEVIDPSLLPEPTTSATDDDFISDTFASLTESFEQVDSGTQNNKNVFTELLGGIKVDLNSIEIDDVSDPMLISNVEDAILENHTTMLVTCCQSSYTAELTALKSQEIQTLANSDVDYYTYKKRLFQTINKHMVNTSVGPIDYGRWLHITSFFDIDTLLYGIYCQTFNYENKYAITCPKCRNSFDAIVNNTTLIEMRGREEETFAKINEIISNIKNADDLLKHSHVHKTKRLSVDESKIIFDIQIPSVYDYLEEVVAKANEEQLEEYQNAIGLKLFIKDIYLPNVLLLKETGKLKYIKLDNGDPAKMLTTISNLSYYDSLQLQNEINSFVEKYQITYSIRNVTCPHCGNIIKTIPLDLEEVLFYTIRRAQRDR